MALRFCPSCIFLLLLLLLLPGPLAGGKLLVVPMMGSHWLSMQKVVEKLSQRGHEVVVVVPEVTWNLKTSQAYKVVTYPVTQTPEEVEDVFRDYMYAHMRGLPFPLNALGVYRSSVEIYNAFFSQCKDLFRSQETLRALNQTGFDAVLTDPIFFCGVTLANYLSLPFVFFMRGLDCNLDFDASQCPSPLSYVPRLFTFNSDRMTFLQRVENALVSLLGLKYCDGYYAEALKFSSEVLQRDVTVKDLLASASIWLMRFDFVFEYARPVMPNMVFVGGINCVDKKPLNKAYAEPTKSDK
ncbi:UDP-glucuronosyltransferase 1-1-like [Empidonax traillii]|uniref:UDP-glucuronosyltransferase 1-1-like n=1 Tax=Empidonax traillii TaxID=164674 RepID=UPI000FFD8062|nr:UDP-glucuronosyltransferase 1-1-like [Empidonax traillii]